VVELAAVVDRVLVRHTVFWSVQCNLEHDDDNEINYNM
jgi:hypothetical protein